MWNIYTCVFPDMTCYYHKLKTAEIQTTKIIDSSVQNLVYLCFN